MNATLDLYAMPGTAPTTPPLPPAQSRVTRLRRFEQISTARTGMLSQLHVEQVLIQRGCQVFRPVLESGEIDLIALTPMGRFWRVQVKTLNLAMRAKREHRPGKGNGSRRQPVLQMNVARRNRDATGKRTFSAPYSQVDVFIGVYEGQCWMIPAMEATGQKKRFGLSSHAREAWQVMGL